MRGEPVWIVVGMGQFLFRKLPFYIVRTIPQMLNRRCISLVTDGFVKYHA